MFDRTVETICKKMQTNFNHHFVPNLMTINANIFEYNKNNILGILIVLDCDLDPYTSLLTQICLTRLYGAYMQWIYDTKLAQWIENNAPSAINEQYITGTIFHTRSGRFSFPTPFNADHPFFFAIIEKSSTTSMFQGRFYL